MKRRQLRSLVGLVVALLYPTLLGAQPLPTLPTLVPWQLQQPSRVTLRNDVELILLKDDTNPLATLQVLVRTGSIEDSFELLGLTEVMADALVLGGSENYPGDKLQLLLARKGATLTAQAGLDRLQITLRCPPEHLEELVPVVADLLRAPSLSTPAVEQAKRLARTRIARRNDYPLALAERELGRQLYGPDNVYGRLPEYLSVAALQPPQLKERALQAFCGSNLVVAASGAISITPLTVTLARLLEPLPKGKRTAFTFPEPSPRTVNTSLVNLPGLTLAVLAAGQLLPFKPADRPALAVLDQVLFAQPLGRLALASAQLTVPLARLAGRLTLPTAYAGSLQLTLVLPAQGVQQAINYVVEELRRLQEQPLTAEELNLALQGLTAQQRLQADDPQLAAANLTALTFEGVEPGGMVAYQQALAALTPAQVQAAARTYLQPEKLHLVVVADRALVEKQLTKRGKLALLDVQIPKAGLAAAVLGDKNAPTVKGDPVKGKALLNCMADSLLLQRDSLASLTLYGLDTRFLDAVPEGHLGVQFVTSYQFPDGLTQQLSIPSLGQQIEVNLQGGKATSTMGGISRIIPAEPLVRELEQNYISLALRRDTLRVEYLGTEKLDPKLYGGVTEVSKLVLETNPPTTLLLHMGSCLPVAARFTVPDANGDKQAVLEERYADWRIAQGVRYAYRIIRYQGRQKTQDLELSNHKASYKSIAKP